jgi:hypothetical protein
MLRVTDWPAQLRLRILEPGRRLWKGQEQKRERETSVNIGRLAVVLWLCASLYTAPVHADGVTDENAEITRVLGPEMAADVAAWEDAFVQAQRDHARALAARGDSDALLGAVLLYPREFGETATGTGQMPVPDEVTGWFTQAVVQAPDDVLIAWLEAVHCPVDAAACDREAALERLREADADNAATWLETMRDADNRSDVAGRERAFSRAAASTHFDIHDRALGRLLAETVKGFRAPPQTPGLLALFKIVAEDTGWPQGEQRVVAQLISLWMHRMIPDVAFFTRTCVQGNEIEGDARHRRECRALFARMADGSTTAWTRQVALGVMVRLTRDLPDGTRWRERYRRYRWLSANAVELISPYHSGLYLRNVLADGEIAAWEALLDAAGKPIDPPDGWLPDSANDRDLILGGRSE